MTPCYYCHDDRGPKGECCMELREAEIDRLRAEVEGLRADAERYRWLRDDSVPPHNFYLSVPDEFAEVRYTPQQVDAAIDAALAKEKAHE
jgi:hypothetical protein